MNTHSLKRIPPLEAAPADAQPQRYRPLRDIIHDLDESHSRSTRDYVFVLGHEGRSNPETDRSTAELIRPKLFILPARQFRRAGRG